MSFLVAAPHKYALDLFSGTGSTTKVLKQHGYTVISLDSDPQYNATIVGSILDWDYGAYAPRHFSLITASPPCTHFSQAKTTGQRHLEYALGLVQRTLEIISYFQQDRWWVETPRYGLLAKHQLMSAYPKWDVDYYQFSLCGFKKPTRFFGSLHLSTLPARLCDGVNCRNLGVG